MEALIKQIADARQALKDIDAKQAAIEAAAEKDNGGKLSDEQATEYDGLSADYEAKSAELVKLEADAKRMTARSERKLPDGPLPRRASHDTRGPIEGTGDVPPAREAKVDTNKIPATVKRYGSLVNFTGNRAGVDADVRAYRFGMWALAKMTLDMPGRYRFTEAVDFFESNKWAVAHQSNNATGTQYLIPEEFGSDMIDLREVRGVVRRLFRKVPMVSDTRTDPRRLGGLTAYFVGEGSAGTESNKTWDQIRLTAKDVMVLARMSNQVSADAVINLGDDLMGEIAYAFADKEDECGFNGTGTSTYGGIVGVKTKLQDVDGAGADSAGLVIQATGNTFGAIVLADFDSVVGKLPQYADTPAAAWVMHRTFYYSVVEKLVQAAGGVPAYEVREGRRNRPLFKGYPVEFSQVMPSATATATVCALLGDFTKGAAFGDRQQESIAFSEHANVGGENVFERNQIAVRGTERFDINVHDVGTASVPGPIVGLQTGT